MRKIAFIGAGSVVFAKNLMADILQHPALAASEICLMDIDPDRLKVADLLGRKIVAQLGVRAKITATLDLRQACRGAKYAITMIQVGGYRPGTLTDFEIPKKYGLRQTIGDTLGIGGIFRALRTIPALAKIAGTLQEVGHPDHFLLNYSNPMAMNVWGVHRATGIRQVGLCHSVQGTSRNLATYAGVPWEDVSYLVAGINHMAFFLEFKYRGQDAYPLLFRALADPRLSARDRVRFEMMRRLGYFVTESSEHCAEYVPYFIHHGDAVIRGFGIPLDEYLRRCESSVATWHKTKRMLLDDRRRVTIRRSVEYGSTIINAMETGDPAVIYGNVPNGELIDNLPADCCVEVPCLVDKAGLQPTRIGHLPPQLAALIRTNVNVQSLAVEAAMTGRRDHIYHAAMLDPHTASQLPLDRIWRLCDDLLAAHQRDGLLGQFAPTKPDTGRPAASLARVIARIDDSALRPGPADRTDLRLLVENDSGQRYRGTLTVGLDRRAFACDLPARVKIDLPAGKTLRQPFTVTRKPGGDQPLDIGLTGEPGKVLAISYRLPARARCQIGVGHLAHPLHVAWSGTTVAEGKIELDRQQLTLDLRLPDTDIQIDPAAFWSGSAIEFFFMAPGKTARKTAPIIQLIALPDPKSPSFIHPDRSPVSKAEIAVRADPGGYDTTIAIPLATAHVPAGQPFLMEIMFRLGALGDAHGRTSAAWQGSPEPHLSAAHFAIIEPVA